MAVCTARHCKSILNQAVKAGRTDSSAIFPTPNLYRAIRPGPAACVAFSTQPYGETGLGRLNSGPSGRTILSSSSRHYLSVKTYGELVRHYSSDAEDFTKGYGGPIQQPVIDWREKHVVEFKEFAKMVETAKVQLIDVREPFELDTAGAIDRSINIPFVHFRAALQMSPEEFKEQYKANQPKKEDDNIVIIDLRGNRSEGALRISHELGFSKVQRFPGGFREWAEKKNLPEPPTYYDHGIPRDHWSNLKYDDLRHMMKKENVYIIDVREPWEVVEEGTITNALNIPMGYLELALNMDEAEFEKQYAVRKPRFTDEIGFISWRGLRSAGCQLLAQELGYQKACNVQGGQKGYKKNREESKRPSRPGRSVSRSHDNVYG